MNKSGRINPKTPPPKRSTRAETSQKIQECIYTLAISTPQTTRKTPNIIEAVSLDEEQPLFQEIKRKLDIQSSTKNFPKKKMLDPQAPEILSTMNGNVKNEIVNFAYEGLAKSVKVCSRM